MICNVLVLPWRRSAMGHKRWCAALYPFRFPVAVIWEHGAPCHNQCGHRLVGPDPLPF
jgi:hypothetical protein